MAAAAPPPAEPLDLSVIIVNYNVREFLEQALRSVERASAGLSVEVFVVDNNSADGSVEMVRAAFPRVQVLANEANVGFGRANNQAIARARGRYLLILNPDTIVREDTFAVFLRFMEAHPEAGAAGCQILNPDGTFAPESRRAFPTPSVAFYRISGLGRLFPRSRRFGRYNLTYLPVDQVAEVDALSGSCMLVRRAALHFRRDDAARLADAGLDPDRLPADSSAGADAGGGAGYFDEDFFMYGEDLDWCYRIQQAGWKIYYTPETQIIHYKGESTKKGELRYVRLFYGAMVQFTDKHFQSRYSRWFAAAIRLGIVARAALTVTASTARRLAPVVADALLVFGVVAVLGLVWSAYTGVGLAPLFYGGVATLYALGAVGGLAAAGGYRTRMRRRLRPVVAGVATGLLTVATLSFFLKDIAFSRAVVALAAPAALVLLAARRLLVYQAPAGPRPAVFVGPPAEAQRLRAMLRDHPQPPFVLLGYVGPDEAPPPGGHGALPRLGSPRNLRDIVRLRGVEQVVFAAGSLSNETIFGLIRQLRTLPVQFKMLAEGRTHVIGKATIDDLSLPSLLGLGEDLPAVRSAAARRAFEVPLALLGLLLHPLLVAAGHLGARRARRLARRTRLLPAVVAGRMALVGCRPAEAPRLPPEWGLLPGVFPISDTLARTGSSRAGLRRTYGHYARHQSTSLDFDILVRSLRRLLQADPPASAPDLP